MAGSKDQFLFNSELSTAVDEEENFLAANDIPKANEKLAQLSKSVKHRQKIINLADKSEAGWLAVKKNMKPRSYLATPKTKKEFARHRKEPSGSKSKMQVRSLIQRTVRLALLARVLLLIRVGQGFWVYGIQGLFKSGVRYIAA